MYKRQNLYDPNDNFDLEKSHVLPALLRKIYLGKCLEDNNWKAISADLDKRPIEGITGNSTQDEILNIFNKYGLSSSPFEKGDKGGLISKISVEIWGTGSPMREFLWSEEMADACVFLMENINFSDVISKEVRLRDLSQQSSKATDSSPALGMTEIRNTHINIGTGKEISIKQLAEPVSYTHLTLPTNREV